MFNSEVKEKLLILALGLWIGMCGGIALPW